MSDIKRPNTQFTNNSLNFDADLFGDDCFANGQFLMTSKTHS